MADRSWWRVAVLIVAGIVVGAAVALGAVSVFDGQLLNDESIPPEDAGSIVKTAMEAQGGSGVTVEFVEEASPSMYMVAVSRTGSDALSRMYVSKDGTYIFNSPTNASALIARTQARNQFIGCLTDRNVQIYGRLRGRPTQLQIQALGGSRGLDGLFRPVNNQSLQALARQGVQRLPATVYNGSIRQGVQSIQQLQSMTGCRYNTTAG